MNSAEEVREALTRLRDAGCALRERDPKQVIDRLAAVLEDWRDPGSRWRARLEREHPSASGFHPAVVRAGLERALENWSGAVLQSLAAEEFAAFRTVGGESKELAAVGFDTTAVVLAGSIPMPTLQAILMPLMLRSPVIAKTASRDPVTARLVAESVRRCDPDLGNCIEVVSFPGNDDDCTRALLEASCVLAYGSDETVASLQDRVGATQRFVPYGHRVSVAALGDPATRGAALAETAEKLAVDAALWDQLGCLSPAAVFVEDLDGKAAPRVAAALAEAFADVEQRLPRGELPTVAAAAIVRERAAAEMRAAAGERCVVHAGNELRWTVVLEADARWRPSPLHRFLRVHPVDSAALLDALAPVAKHLAGVAIAGLNSSESALGLARLGISFIQSIGSMQAPPFGWHHEEGSALRRLTRTPDFES